MGRSCVGGDGVGGECALGPNSMAERAAREMGPYLVTEVAGGGGPGPRPRARAGGTR